MTPSSRTARPPPPHPTRCSPASSRPSTRATRTPSSRCSPPTRPPPSWGGAEEWGREVIARGSLAEALASPLPQRAELGTLAGEPVVRVLTMGPDGPPALSWRIRLGVEDGRVCTWRSSSFTPELLAHAAAERGLPAVTAGYRHVGPAAA